MSDQSMSGDPMWPPGITADDAQALDELAAAGIGEGDFGESHDVPPELTDLFIELEGAGVSPDEFRELAEGGLL